MTPRSWLCHFLCTSLNISLGWSSRGHLPPAASSKHVVSSTEANRTKTHSCGRPQRWASRMSLAHFTWSTGRRYRFASSWTSARSVAASSSPTNFLNSGKSFNSQTCRSKPNSMTVGRDGMGLGHAPGTPFGPIRQRLGGIICPGCQSGAHRRYFITGRPGRVPEGKMLLLLSGNQHRTRKSEPGGG